MKQIEVMCYKEMDCVLFTAIALRPGKYLEH